MSGDFYYRDFLVAFVRGRTNREVGSIAEALAVAKEEQLRIHKYKRSIELPRVRKVLGTLRGLAPASLVDIGSGRGTFLWPLLDAFPELPVHAIDVDERRVADLDCVRRGGIEQLTASHMDVHALALADASADGVCALEVLEHLANPAQALAECARVAERFVLVSVPSHEDDNPEHIHLFDPRRLATMMTDVGLRPRVEHVLNHTIALGMK